MEEKLNFLFTTIFLIELVVKFLALGVHNFFFGGQLLNIFDLIIVCGSVIDILISNILQGSVGNQSSAMVTALRGFRLLRIFKLAR